MGIDEVDAMTADEFVTAFGSVYEHSPHLAERAWKAHPFGSLDALVGAFTSVADDLDGDEVLALLRAHPQLGTARPLTAASASEQASAGLTTLADDVATRLADGNAAYLERFGFPFIIAVLGRSQAEVLDALGARLANDRPTEQATALSQVQRIAGLRLHGMVAA